MSDNNNVISNDNSDLDAIIDEVKKEFNMMLGKRKGLIIKLGLAFEAKVSNSESVCEEIKNVLHEEIAQKLISTRDIERYCLDKWKRKTGPKKKIDKMSISGDKRQDTSELLVHADGSTVTESADVTNSSSNNGDDVNNERSDFGARCIHEDPSDIQLNEANGASSPLTSSDPQLLEQDGSKEFETKIARLQQDLASKSKENLILQSQVVDLKSKLGSNASGGDRFFDVRFQVSFEDLRRQMSACYSRNKGVSKVIFTAKVDLAKRDLTEIEVVGADSLESTNEQ